MIIGRAVTPYAGFLDEAVRAVTAVMTVDPATVAPGSDEDQAASALVAAVMAWRGQVRDAQAGAR